MSALPADPARLFLDEACAARRGRRSDPPLPGAISTTIRSRWRPAAGMNSIGNLVLHLAGNLRQRVEANVGRQADVRDRFGEFTEREAIPRAELLRRFDESVAAAVARLESLSPETLSEMRPIERGGKWSTRPCWRSCSRPSRTWPGMARRFSP